MSSDNATLGFRRLTDSRLPRRLMGILEEPGMVAIVVGNWRGVANYMSPRSEVALPSDTSSSSCRRDDGIVGERR